MKIELIQIDKITPYKLNAKKHPQSQIEGIAESIKRFGFTQPVVIDGKGEIIIGHGRVEGAKLSGLKEIPCVRRNDLNESEIRALRLIDNRISETGWDGELLNVDLESLDFDFEPFNIDFDKLRIAKFDGLTDEDAVPDAPKEPVSKTGDIYQLGKHRVMCGNSTVATDVDALLDGVKPHLMVTDPPYGVNYDPEWRNEADSANGKPYGARAVGKVENDDRADWSEAYSLFPGDVIYTWHPAGAKSVEFFNSILKSGFDIRMQIIWAKSHFPIGRGHYHVQHEPCWYAVRKGANGHWVGDRKQTTLWKIDKPMKSETGHSTQKPVECMRRPILNNSSPGQAVYDPFLGSGTTLIAAEGTGRVCYGMEISPAYVQIVVERWCNFTGKKAELISKKAA